LDFEEQGVFKKFFLVVHWAGLAVLKFLAEKGH